MGNLFGERVSEILPGLYLGGMPWATWDLEGAGISLVVNLAANLSAHSGEKSGLTEAHGGGRVGYLHWPLEDGDVPDRDILSLLVRIIGDGLDEGRGVLVHCSAGVNRSALVVALVVRQRTGCSGAEALALVQERRPGTLRNSSFVAYLEDLGA